MLTQRYVNVTVMFRQCYQWPKNTKNALIGAFSTLFVELLKSEPELQAAGQYIGMAVAGIVRYEC